jgi:hypothetical protein
MRVDVMTKVLIQSAKVKASQALYFKFQPVLTFTL